MLAFCARCVYVVSMTATTTIKVTKARRAVIYLRVSTDGQVESGLGLEAQLEACVALCAARGYEVAAVLRDEGVSGSTAVAKRPGLLAAVAALGRGAVLVAAKRDRLARSVGIAAVLEAAVHRAGATIDTPDAPDSADPAAVAMRGMIDVFAQFERARIAERTKAALAVKKARGEKTGGALPFGYALADDGKTLVADAAELEALEIIRALRADGLSMRDIVARLNAEGVPCRGSRWHLTTVARVIPRAAA